MVELKKFCALLRRNITCYFRDRFLFLVSMITPMILLVLFVTFLRSTYIESFNEVFKAFSFEPSKRVVDGLAGAWLLSSIMAVCSVTVAICSNAIMVQDKADGQFNDFKVSPVKGVTVSLAYFAGNFLVTLLVMLAVLIIGLVYIAIVGWQLSFGSIMLILLDVIVSVLFGSLLSSVIASLVSSPGGMSALSALVSAMYGFICGAYIPLAQFAEGIRNAVCFLPGTYCVGILRKHFMTDYINKLCADGLPSAGGTALLDAFDGNIYVFGSEVGTGAMYGIVLGACAVLLAFFVLIVYLENKKKVK